MTTHRDEQHTRVWSCRQQVWDQPSVKSGAALDSCNGGQGAPRVIVPAVVRASRDKAAAR